MAELNLTPKQERFCIEYLKDGNASEAYRRAYSPPKSAPATINRDAHDLIHHPKIVARLEELQAPIRNAAQLTVESHLEELARLRQLALLSEKHGAAITAEMARGKVAGFYIEKMQVDVTLRGLAERMRARKTKA